MKMSRRQGLCFALGLAGVSITGRVGGAPLVWRETALLAMGTTVWLRAAHADAARAQAAVDAAATAVQRVEALMSLYRPESELCRLNREGELRHPAPELLAVLRLAQQVAAASGGTFDPTVQPLWLLWQRAHSQGRRPSDRELGEVLPLVDWRGLHLHDDHIRLAKPGMALTLNGIAQGFAADQARAALQRHGIEHALLDTGEWWPMGQAPDGQAWHLGIAKPALPTVLPAALLATLLSDGRAVACSADDKQSFSADRRDHHIFDPRSGRSPPTLSTVVVAAPSAALADALTKPMFMGTVADALVLARRWKVDVLAMDKAGRWAASPGLRLSRA